MSVVERVDRFSTAERGKENDGLDLDRMLAALEVRVEPFAVCAVQEDCRLPLQPQPFPTFHYVLTGHGTAFFRQHGSFDLAPHSIVICPSGLSQRFESTKGEYAPAAPRGDCVDPAQGLIWLSAGEGEKRMLMACGRLLATCGQSAGLFERMPRPLLGSSKGDTLLQSAFKALLEELADPRPGTVALTATLMKECLIRLLRKLESEQETVLPMLAAAADPRLAPALEAILTRPADELGVDRLAELSGMSRSAFSHHFTSVMGVAPHEFLTERRLSAAARLLLETDLPVKTVAGRVGFKSRSHFSHAFKGRYGDNPASYRKAAER